MTESEDAQRALDDANDTAAAARELTQEIYDSTLQMKKRWRRAFFLAVGLLLISIGINTSNRQTLNKVDDIHDFVENLCEVVDNPEVLCRDVFDD